MSIHLELSGSGSLQQRVARALEVAIRSKRLPAGCRLPSSRELARDLGVARNTASLAVEDLIARGLAHAVPRKGVFVNAIASYRDTTSGLDAQAHVAAPSRRALALLEAIGSPQISPASRHQFDYGQPLVPPALLRAWRQSVQRAADRLTPDYPPPTGLPVLRSAIAGMLATRRGMTVDVENIIVVAGAQQAFDLIASVLVDPKTGVAIEDPGYEGARLAYSAAGAELHACAVDDDGMRVDQLPADGVRVIHVTPSHQFPTGAQLSTERRHALLTYADRHAGVIVEDDYDAELRFGSAAVPSLYALAGGGPVIYVGTFSKMLFPSMRLGYVVVPRSLRALFAAAKLAADRGSSMLEQAAVAEMFASGAVDRHLRKLSRELERRRFALTDTIERLGGGRIEIMGINAGMHVVAKILNLPWSRLDELDAVARSMGLNLVPVKPHFLEVEGDVAVLLGFSSAAPASITAAARCLCRAVDRLFEDQAK